MGKNNNMKDHKTEKESIWSKLLSEGAAIILLALGVAVIFIGLFAFWSQESIFSTSQSVKSEKVGQLGDFVGGVVGSLWALAGVILFYIALNKQKESLEIQRQELKSTKEEFILNRITNLLYHQLGRIEAQIQNFNYTEDIGFDLPVKVEGLVAINKLSTMLQKLEKFDHTDTVADGYYSQLTIATKKDLGAFQILFIKSADIIEAFDEQLRLASLDEDVKSQLYKLLAGNLGHNLIRVYKMPIILDKVREAKYQKVGGLANLVLKEGLSGLMEYSKKISSFLASNK